MLSHCPATKMFRIIVCLLAVASASCTRSDKGLVFKYANEQPEAAIRSQSMLYFEEELEKRTDG
ncbi:MAG: hypothetical protein EP299_05385, partial [Acidobacteria bacterium]